MGLLGVILGVMAICQVVARLYAQRLQASGNSEVARAHREAAANGTVFFVLLTLFLWPSPWYKQPPLDGVHRLLAQNLKPRDSLGHGWFAPQTYKDNAEFRNSQWMFSTAHKTLMAAILATLCGVAAGAMTKLLEVKAPPRYRPPSGPFQDRW